MRFEKITSDRLRIVLSPQDMALYHLTYRQMEPNDPATRSFLQMLLVLAEEMADFSCPNHSRLLIELFPASSDGCTVLFTLLGSPKANRCHVYAFLDLEALTRCAVKASGLCGFNTESCTCSLYRLAEEYRILCCSSKDSPVCLPLLSEYGLPAGEGELAAAFTQEHGTLLAAPDAMARIADCLR